MKVTDAGSIDHAAIVSEVQGTEQQIKGSVQMEGEWQIPSKVFRQMVERPTT